MPNFAHIALVGDGADAVAHWRAFNQKAGLDLSYARLFGRSLAKIDFRWARLRAADLRRSSLSQCDLTDADLSEAQLGLARVTNGQLDRSDVRRADLGNASVLDCSLREVSLGGANLGRTVFRGVDFVGSSWAGAQLSGTVLADCDLSLCTGLARTSIIDPPSVSVRTLELTLRGSGGLITNDLRTFLSGCDLPDHFVDQLPSLMSGPPIHFYRSFISYGSEDNEFVTKLFEDLTDLGIKCWKFDIDAVGGRTVWANIDRAIALNDKVILACSQNALNSGPVQREIERALVREDGLRKARVSSPTVDADILVPIDLDGYVHTWEHERRRDVTSKFIINFRDWRDDTAYLEALEKLVQALVPGSFESGVKYHVQRQRQTRLQRVTRPRRRR